MTEHELAKAAKRAVKSIVADLSDRRGLRQEWEQIDDDIRLEIKREWETKIKEAFAIEE